MCLPKSETLGRYQYTSETAVKVHFLPDQGSGQLRPAKETAW
jgi:hypothetical protein